MNGQALNALRRLHQEVERRAEELAKVHGERLTCARGCSACCLDGLTVFSVEAERIRAAHATLLEKGLPHAAGACAFLDEEGACRIYAERPYVCRTQGLPLRWIDESAEGLRVERRDICELNEEGDPLTALPERACWTLGPTEARLAAIQKRFQQGGRQRTPLRELFRREAPPAEG